MLKLTEGLKGIWGRIHPKQYIFDDEQGWVLKGTVGAGGGGGVNVPKSDDIITWTKCYHRH